jgi:hypothetical protein
VSSAPQDRGNNPSRRFVPSNKEMAEILKNSPLGPMPGPSQRRRNRAEGKKFEKAMDAEHARGDENWPPK